MKFLRNVLHCWVVVARKGVEFYWKRAMRSLTCPLRGISLLSEATETTVLVFEVVLGGVVTGGEVGVGVGLVTVGVGTEREVGVVELVTGGEVGVVMGRVVGLVMGGDLEVGLVAEEVGLLMVGEVGKGGEVGVREEGDNGFSISAEARFSSRALTRFFLFCTEPHTAMSKYQ